MAVDAVMSGLAAAVSILVASNPAAELRHAYWIGLYLAMTWVAIVARGGFRSRLGFSGLGHLGQIVMGTTIATACTIAVRVALEPATPPASTVRLWGLAVAALLGGRLALYVHSRLTRSAGVSTLIVGAGQVGQRLARHLLERPEFGLRPIGFLDENPLPGLDHLLPVVGAPFELRSVVDRCSVERVLVSFSTSPHPAMLALVRECHALDVEVSLVPRFFESVSRRFEVDHVGGIPLLHLGRIDARGWQFTVKSVLDRVAAVVVLAAFALPGLFVAALVAASLGRPIFFRQTRVGRDGKEFDLLKFRTLIPCKDGLEADAAWAAASLGVPPPPVPTVDRATPFGRILRRTCLDELPQLLNIARGEMSFIGPRPERPGYVRAFEEQVYRYGDRHRVKAGLTGWAQIQGLRGECSLTDRVEWDNYYVENWTPLLDLRILLLTIPSVVRGVGDRGSQMPEEAVEGELRSVVGDVAQRGPVPAILSGDA